MCWVVGFRGLWRPLDEKQGFPTNNSPLAPRSKFPVTGKALLGRSALQFSLSPWRESASLAQNPRRAKNLHRWLSRMPRTAVPTWGPRLPGGGRGFGILLWLPDGKKINSGAASLQSSYIGRLCPPSPFSRDARPGTEPRASMQMLSGALALGSLGLRPGGKNFLKEGLGLEV